MYLIFLEMKDSGLIPTYKKIENEDKFYTEDDYDKLIEDWKKKFTKELPKKIKFTYYPLFFNYTNENLISTYIEENSSEIFKNPNKSQVFLLSCKIFEYPNRIMSVRIIIAWYLKVGDHEFENKDSNH